MRLSTLGGEVCVVGGWEPTRRRIFALAVAGVILIPGGGCKTQQNARYIYQDGEFGVIGIPQNSPFGSNNYQQQAATLMAQHFPGGYEVVRAEEVVEGQRVLDKSRKSEFETDPSINALNQRIQLGKLAQTTSTQQKDSLPILESRIIYKRRTETGPKGVNGYAASAAVIPEFYLDPNEMARCRERIELAELKKSKSTMTAAKASDTAGQKTSHDQPSDKSKQ
jgi:hypothetical protein